LEIKKLKDVTDIEIEKALLKAQLEKISSMIDNPNLGHIRPVIEKKIGRKLTSEEMYKMLGDSKKKLIEAINELEKYEQDNCESGVDSNYIEIDDINKHECNDYNNDSSSI
jgi:hypothetical protein